MAARCDICSKEPRFGNNVARAGRSALRRYVKRRTPRRFMPNLQTVRTTVNGTPKRLRVCTSCLKKGKVEQLA